MGETTILLQECENQVWVGSSSPPPPPIDELVIEKTNPYAGMWITGPYLNKRTGAYSVSVNSLKYGRTSTPYARYLVTKAIGRHLVWTRDLDHNDPNYVHEIVIHLDNNNGNNDLTNLAIRNAGKVTPVLSIIALEVKQAEAEQRTEISTNEPTASTTETVNVTVSAPRNYTIFSLMIKWGHTYRRTLAKLRKSKTRVFERNSVQIFPIVV
jgi:hypothetical protein